MKALVLAAVLAAFTSIAPAGAARDTKTQAAIDKTAAVVMADASRMGSAGLSSLSSNNSVWPSQGGGQADIDFDSLSAQVEPGALFITLGVLALVLARPITRVLRRQEQNRRAAALASTLDSTPHL